MAFNTNPGKQSFTATAGQTVFDFNFKIFVETDIKVYLTPVGSSPDDANDILVYGTEYTVVIDGDDGGTVTLLTGATLNDTIVLARELPQTRATSYVTNGDLKAATLNIDQDYQSYLILDSYTALGNAVQLPQSAVGVNPVLPNVRSDSYLKWNVAGDALENDETVPQAVIDTSDNVLNANSWANEDEDVPVKVYTNGVGTDRVPTVYSAKHYRAKAEGFKDGAELEKWDAEAKALTALSYATEAEDTPVNVVRSDGDGTFTYTPQAGVFSSLHHAAKAALSAASIGHAITSTIATLRAMTTTPSTIYVTGYTTANDGAFGSHFFKWNSTSTDTDNGGTIIKLDAVTTGRYELQYDGAVNVKWFGAKGDGIANDTDAIQRSLDAADGVANTVVDLDGLDCKVVITDGGTNKTVYALLMNKSNTTVKNGTIRCSETQGDVIRIVKGTSNLVFDNITAVGAAITNPPELTPYSQVPLHFLSNQVLDLDNYGNNYSIINCDWSGFNSTTRIGNVDGVTVRDSKFSNNKYIDGWSSAYGGYGLATNSCTNVFIYNNLFTSVSDDRHAIYIADSGYGVRNKNIIIENNICEWGNTNTTVNPFMGAINIRHVSNCIISNNIIYNSKTFAIAFNTADGSSDNIKINNNLIVDMENKDTEAPGAAISMVESGGNGYSNVDIHDNQVSLVGVGVSYGVLTSGTKLSIKSNTIEMTNASHLGILLYETTSNSDIGTNNFYGNSVGQHCVTFRTGSHTRLTIGKQNHYDITGSVFNTLNPSTTTFPAVTHNYAIQSIISSDGVGGITFSNFDGLIDSVVSHANGYVVNFIPEFGACNNMTISIISRNKNTDIHYLVTTGTNSVTIGYADAAGVDKPLATNAIAVRIIFDNTWFDI